MMTSTTVRNEFSYIIIFFPQYTHFIFVNRQMEIHVVWFNLLIPLEILQFIVFLLFFFFIQKTSRNLIFYV